jgi:hypothetical protein
MPIDRADDSRLTDERLAAEIELLGRVIAVAAEHEERLTDSELDQALGPPNDEHDEHD